MARPANSMVLIERFLLKKADELASVDIAFVGTIVQR
jgi:hypothetical protein